MPSAAATPTEKDKLPTLREFFSPGGVLAQSSLTYEHRPGQFEMAKAVERALEEKRHLIVEAGTGTGKTLAYLLPALRMARDRASASSSAPAPRTCRNSSSSKTSRSLSRSWDR